jgi:hypothetical protein
VRASDGTIWAGGDVGRFTRITPAAQISTVVAPGLSAEPAPIGFDTRGDLWFTRWSRRRLPCAIGRLSPEGSVVEYPVRHVGELTWISIERNDDLSFGTEFPSGEGRMTPGGKLTSLRRHRRTRGSHARTVASAPSHTRPAKSHWRRISPSVA